LGERDISRKAAQTADRKAFSGTSSKMPDFPVQRYGIAFFLHKMVAKVNIFFEYATAMIEK
jgi:hypothetical protein